MLHLYSMGEHSLHDGNNHQWRLCCKMTPEWWLYFVCSGTRNPNFPSVPGKCVLLWQSAYSAITQKKLKGHKENQKQLKPTLKKPPLVSGMKAKVKGNRRSPPPPPPNSSQKTSVRLSHYSNMGTKGMGNECVMEGKNHHFPGTV